MYFKILEAHETIDMEYILDVIQCLFEIYQKEL